MDYFVIGPDGKEYGPASLDTLKSWVAENRISPSTMLKNFQSGQTVAASTIPALFPISPPPMMAAPPPGTVPPGDWSKPPSAVAAYPRGNAPSAYVDSGKGDVIYAIAVAVLAVVCFYYLHTIGVFIAIAGLVRAIRAKEKGHALANIAIAISVVSLILIGIGWAMRLKGAGV